MSEESWDEQFKRFLRKTGADFRRASAEVTAEAQKLVEAAMDPEKQQKVRDRLSELGLWARKKAEGVAGAVEQAATKAEAMFHDAMEKKAEGKSAPEAPAADRATPSPPARKAAKTKSAKPAKKGAARRRKR